jgi:hypothetical protein
MVRKCRVHGTELKSGKQDVRRGEPPAPPEGYFAAIRELFPNAKSFEMGGCLVGVELKDEKKVRFCPACREAEKDWQAGRRDVEDFWQA